MNDYAGVSTLESMSQAKFYNRWTFNKFSKYLKGTILEVGCGIGNFTKELSKYGDVTGIDIDESLINEFKKESRLRIQLGFGDIEENKFFFNNKVFDTIVCLNVLEHIEDDKRALQNIFNLLKKDGFMILVVPINKFLFGEIDKAIGHKRRYAPENLTNCVSGFGFDIVYQRKLNFIGSIGWFIAGRVLKEKTVKEQNIKLFNIVSPIFLWLENFIEPLFGTSILIIAKKSK